MLGEINLMLFKVRKPQRSLRDMNMVPNARIDVPILPDSAGNLPCHSAIIPGSIDRKLFCSPHYPQIMIAQHSEKAAISSIIVFKEAEARNTL
jgi:hypothetical protein